MRDLFLLDPDVVFLNHGSYGACPRPVFEEYQRLQRELERQPVRFLGREARDRLAASRSALGSFLNCAPHDVVYFPNPTTAVNVVARSLALGEGDEVLTTDHEYGAMDRTWRFVCRKTGARYVQQPIPLPLRSDDFVEQFWRGVNERTRVVFLSHLTSPTALIFPIDEIVRRARESGLFTIIDGAHAPGQIPLDVESVGADIYVGACHKWLMAPKGAAFLHARKAVQTQLEPLVVSWGYEEGHYKTGHTFIDWHEWQGTRDIAAFLSVPAACRFQQEHNWDEVRRRCHTLAVETRERINGLTGLDSICADTAIGQFFAARLPAVDVQQLKTRLYDEFRIEVPVIQWNDQQFVRVSFQGYNTADDADALVGALEKLLPEVMAD